MIRQRRETAEAATQGKWETRDDRDYELSVYAGPYPVVHPGFEGDGGMDRNDADHVCANDPAAVIALCDGALKLLDGAEADYDGDTHSECAEWILHTLAAMFGVSQEGTP